MNIVSSSYIFLGVIVLIAILIIVSIAKKAIKLLIFAIGLIVVFSAYNIFVKGVSPIEELQSYKTNIKYGKSISDYTMKIDDSITNIKNTVTSGKINPNGVEIIKTENKKLHKYQSEVKALEHTEMLNTFHNKYNSYLKDIVAGSDVTLKTVSAGEKGIAVLKDTVEKLTVTASSMSKLKANSSK